MLLERLTEPAPAIHPGEILSFLREASTAEASLIESYCREAQDVIADTCERAVSVARWRLTFSMFPVGMDDAVGPEPHTRNFRAGAKTSFFSTTFSAQNMSWNNTPAVTLNMPPVRSIESVKYYDTDNVLQTWDPANYQLHGEEPALLVCAPGHFWPPTYHRRDAIQVTFWAGSTDQIEFTVGETQQWHSASGMPYANGDLITLRVSGNQNEFLGNVAAVPDGFVNMRTYHVVDTQTNGRFSLAATASGTAIVGSLPAAPLRTLGTLFSGSLKGPVSKGLRKIIMESFVDRCAAGTCSCTGLAAGASMQYPAHLRAMLWRPVLQVQ